VIKYVTDEHKSFVDLCGEVYRYHLKLAQTC